MYINRIINGEALETLRTIPNELVDMCVTSPPYWNLRDYGHGDQIGLEETPKLYVDRLVYIFEEVRRILRPNGTLWLNLGDTYAANGLVACGIKQKDLVGIPWMVAFALRECGWYLRSDIIWHKPNPMPESVTDRPTKAHEYLFLFSKQPTYYFNQEDVGEPAKEHIGEVRENRTSNTGLARGIYTNADRAGNFKSRFENKRNIRTVWSINSKPYEGMHFAVFPPKLVELCIKAGSKEGDIVLDPFMGSGTVAMVALRHRRNYLGIELNPEYCKLINERTHGVQLTIFD